MQQLFLLSNLLQFLVREKWEFVRGINHQVTLLKPFHFAEDDFKIVFLILLEEVKPIPSKLPQCEVLLFHIISTST